MYVYHTVYGLFCTSPREFVLWKFSFVLPLVPRFLSTCCYNGYIHNVLQLYRLQLHMHLYVSIYNSPTYMLRTYINNAYMYIAVTSTRIRGKNSDKLHQKHLHQNKRATGTSIIQWLHVEQEYMSFLVYNVVLHMCIRFPSVCTVAHSTPYLVCNKQHIHTRVCSFIMIWYRHAHSPPSDIVLSISQ